MVEVPESHENFSLSKREQDDITIGHPNRVNLLCPNSYLLIAPKGTAIKVQKNVSPAVFHLFFSKVSLILNEIDTHEHLDKYWEFSDITNFHNI